MSENKVVPVEPTRSMIIAGKMRAYGGTNVCGIWEAMLAAAPQGESSSDLSQNDPAKSDLIEPAVAATETAEPDAYLITFRETRNGNVQRITIASIDKDEPFLLNLTGITRELISCIPLFVAPESAPRQDAEQPEHAAPETPRTDAALAKWFQSGGSVKDYPAFDMRQLERELSALRARIAEAEKWLPLSEHEIDLIRAHFNSGSYAMQEQKDGNTLCDQALAAIGLSAVLAEVRAKRCKEKK